MSLLQFIMSVYDALLTLVDILINPPEVSSALGDGQHDTHTVTRVAEIRVLTIASQSGT